jgi:uncharacterized protein YqjF (DUF2071 family)/predicted DCC family thiol-disulfide oxidoreductase YuxK
MGPGSGSRDVAEPQGWVLYDAGCGVCARWVPFWAPTLARIGLAVAPLQAPWVAGRIRVAPDALLRDLRLLLRDGRELAGADAYRYVMRRLWWAYPLYLLAVTPGLRALFDRAYRAFADHRLRISEVCGLRPPGRGPEPLAPPAARKAGGRRFLTAEWRYVVMLTYEVAPEILAPLVPAGTVLDLWQGQALVTVVGFRFLDARLLGVPVPFHRAFDEVNLRFYVRRFLAESQVRPGVVFVRELVPRRAVALVARLAYREPYRVARMRSQVPDRPLDGPGRLTYEWQSGGAWERLAATPVGRPAVPAVGSEAAFIAQRHWGYTPRRRGGTLEYEVMHPAWRVWAGADPVLEADVARLYGPPFARALSRPPVSALVVEGSAVAVSPPRRLPEAVDARRSGRSAASRLFRGQRP